MFLICLSACEGQSGYLDSDQEETLSLLTEKEWLIVYARYWTGDEHTYDDETSVYFLDLKQNGWVALGSLKDASVKENVTYFQWRFTTDNFTVIQTAGNGMDGYWLIEKLTPTELWAQWSAKDPVMYPNQITTFYKFKSRDIAV